MILEGVVYGKPYSAVAVPVPVLFPVSIPPGLLLSDLTY